MMNLPSSPPDWRHPSVFVPIGRFGVLALCLATSLVAPVQPAPASLVALSAAAVVATLPLRHRYARVALNAFEAIAASGLIAAAMPSGETLLPYLVVPSFAAGFTLGIRLSFLITSISIATFALVRVLDYDADAASQLIDVVQWMGVAMTAALMSGWARSLIQEEKRTTTSYASAHQLLTELRDVSRELPSGLDEVALAQAMLSSVGGLLPFDLGAVYVHDEKGIITPLAYLGADRLVWNPRAGDDLWGPAFAATSPMQLGRSITPGKQGYCAVLPIRLGDRVIGLVAVERTSGPWPHRNLVAAQSLVDDAGLQLETGQLFSEVRSIATVEERRRLAREIHDGIAQELASLGYVVDDLSARSADPEITEELADLRGELTRMVSELRLSIFDLRSDVQPSTGLGAALSSYLRTMGTGSGLTMHMILDESSMRLPVEVETEVLRIAQEAITNARKHSRARNLWVTCRVDPPRVFLRVADDGQGLGSPRADSYGLEIMRERADRIGGDLSMRQRVGGGTVVELTHGSPTVVITSQVDPRSPSTEIRRSSSV